MRQRLNYKLNYHSKTANYLCILLGFRFVRLDKSNTMHINKCKAIGNVAILDKLFLIGDLIYCTEPIYI